jgi:hypothetical protein
MNNILKLISFSLLSLFVLIGSSLAQESRKESKTKKGCGGGCCSNKTEMAESDDHSSMMKLKSADKNNDGVVYECPMKCEPAQDEEGECSKCGMKLKEVSLKNLEHKHGKESHKMMDHSKMKKGHMDHKKMSDIHSIDKNKDGKLYQCPMKCEAPQDNPGDCSKCGMHLKETDIKALEGKK